MKRKQQSDKTIRFFCAGVAPGPEGEGAAIGWVCTDTGQKHFEYVDFLTSDQVQYKAIIEVLLLVPERSRVEVCIDSERVCHQLHWERHVSDPDLEDLLGIVRNLTEHKELVVTFECVPPDRNRAAGLFRELLKAYVQRN